ncbi:uncharacterized protein TNCV_46811 [Trichonephila clavipes]|nr:uncharacterized protein TNCV_46811 [Trichonephila clavipes]
MPVTRALDEQLKALLEGINALKSGQEDMQKSQEETKERMENMQEEIKNELKERMEKGHQEIGEAAEILQILPDTERLNFNSLYNALDLRFSQKYSKDYACLQMKTRLQKTGESLQEYASEVERLANLAFSDHPATVREAIFLQYFVDGLKDGEIQKAVRMADVQDLKSALFYALKLGASDEASYRDSHSVRGARVTTDAPCESPWREEIEKLRKEIQNLMAQRQNLRRRKITCWGCDGVGHLRSSCPRINKEDPCRTSVTESKKVCSNRKGSDENGDVRSKRPCSESSKNLSNCLRVEKKFDVIDPVVRHVTTPSTSALDPWSDESVRKDQLADPEIKPII